LHSPSVSFRHLERMTDSTGLLEHSLGIVPRRLEGYTTDDNARALWLCVERLDRSSEWPMETSEREVVCRLIDTYLSFLLWAQKEDGTFHNNFSYDRRPEPEVPSDDCQGRALWACAVAFTKLRQPERVIAAGNMLRSGMARYREMTFPRGWAYALAACGLVLARCEAADFTDRLEHLSVANGHPPDILEEFRNAATWLEGKLIRSYKTHADENWRWFEPAMTYGNGLLPWALAVACRATGNREALKIAGDSLQFLIARMTSPEGHIRPVGNQGWCTRDHQSLWDQQPLEVMKLALSCREMYFLTGKAEYKRVVEKCRAWFYGENDLRQALADAEEGSCSDGLTPNGINLNRGAESTLAFLLTEMVYGSMQLFRNPSSSARNGSQP